MSLNNNKTYRDLSDVIVKSLEIIPKSETLLIDNLTWLLSSYHVPYLCLIKMFLIFLCIIIFYGTN